MKKTPIAQLWSDYTTLRRKCIKDLLKIQKKAQALGGVMAIDIDHLVEKIANTLPEGK